MSFFHPLGRAMWAQLAASGSPAPPPPPPPPAPAPSNVMTVTANRRLFCGRMAFDGLRFTSGTGVVKISRGRKPTTDYIYNGTPTGSFPASNPIEYEGMFCIEIPGGSTVEVRVE